jgi:hypothetical protein
MALAFAVTAGSLTSPGTAYAKHGDGAAIALGIIGGALAGAAIASSTAPAYYAAIACPKFDPSEAECAITGALRASTPVRATRTTRILGLLSRSPQWRGDNVRGADFIP